MTTFETIGAAAFVVVCGRLAVELVVRAVEWAMDRWGIG